MGGHLQPLVSVLRVPGDYGEKWTWSTVVQHFSPTHAHLEAALRGPTIREFRQMCHVLGTAGIQTFSFTRMKGDDVLTHHWDIIDGRGIPRPPTRQR